MQRSMRLDVSRFARERYAGLLVILITVSLMVLTLASVGVDIEASSYYLRGTSPNSNSYELKNSLQLFQVIEREPIVAVMFESPTCPTCQRMKPYWHMLEIVSDKLGIKFYHIVYSSATHEAFVRYRVEETPTFIVFVNGKPVDRHVGDFVADNITRAMLEWVKSAVREASMQANVTSRASYNEESSQAFQAGVGVAAFATMLAAALVAGILATFSPCVLPVLVAYATSSASRGTQMPVSMFASCSAAAAGGALALGMLFVIAGAVAANLQSLILPSIALAIVAAGIAMMLGVPMEFATMRARRAGLLGFCSLYGVVALQCTLPLVAGALLLAMGAGDILRGVLVALAFALGLGASLGGVMYASSRLGAEFARKLVARSTLLNRIGGLVMVAAGAYLLAYALGVV
ncbi:cytochrome c biogenesis protein transmembrane region [Pyrolobus fumarii 1A]|uniref:Cytochrome c biogenesis protein transmembrane region n=1 Tax=Pyrolobus fumarii (strain DSM 11204 / 1A) TaxID=694429 RepID=G0EH66_PYRF1|nr:thioredoxin fold domain-containing protein [Pyrolobus fumarii]AEM39290.1 cytochrome c biogenesis protein transmembrane region [Pyrolobus fumarii 1A]